MDKIYNINDFTDSELYDILDLNNPTDRELEAKILFMIKKYKDIDNKTEDSIKLMNFFETIYDHFFNDEEYDEEDNEDDNNVNVDEKEEILNIKENEEYKSNKDNEVTKKNINYTKPLEYISGSLNPILQPTIKRVISIDSQYRSDKRTMTTEFTCNLTEPLKDVVLMKLYSIQIPLTWYTVSKSFGSNLIFLKDNVPGIDNDTHNIQYEIEPGYYNPTKLKNAINDDINLKKLTFTDISFGDTQLEYSDTTSIMKFNVDLLKTYNENNYQLEFENSWSSPYQEKINRNTIASYLGFDNKINDMNTVTSEPIISETEDTDIFYLTTNNNSFIVKKYYNTEQVNKHRYNENTSIVDIEKNIEMTLPVDISYTRSEIINNINEQLANDSFFIDSTISRNNLHPDNNNQPFMSDISYNKKYYSNLKIKPNRNVSYYNKLNKTLVEFPDDYTIWLGEDSCFQFDLSINEMNNIKGKTPILEQTDRYYIHTSPYVEFKCIEDNFIMPENDFSFNIVNSHTSNGLSIDQDIDTEEGGYELNQYLKQINQGLHDISSNLLINQLIDLSLSNIDTNFSDTNQPDGTCLYKNGDFITFKSAFTKNFTEEHYYVDLSGTFFSIHPPDISSNTSSVQTSFSNGTETTSNSNTDLFINDITKEISNSHDLALTSVFTIFKNSKILTIYPKQNNNPRVGNEFDVSYNIFFGDTTNNGNNPNQLYFLVEVQTMIQEQLNNFQDEFGNNILSESTITIENIDPTATGTEKDILIKLNLKIKKQITSRGYSIQFVDNITENNGNFFNAQNEQLNPFSIKNTWKDYLKFDPIMIDDSYSLKQGDLNTNIELFNNSIKIGEIYSDQTIDLIGIDKVDDLILLIVAEGLNNKIKIKGIDNGVQTVNGENDFILEVPQGQYNKLQLIKAINNTIANFNNNENKHIEGELYIIRKRELVEGILKDSDIAVLDLTITKNYTTVDYRLSFFDEVSFVSCGAGVQSVRNTTWDSTLGWILGYREFTVYDLSVFGETSSTNSNLKKIVGDTGVSTNLYNYFLLCIDDFNQNHLNDGLVTIASNDTTVPLPSYAERTDFQCDPITGNKIYNASTNLTMNQQYAAVEIANSQQNQTSIGTSVSVKSYGVGPYVKDVFGILPLKTPGLNTGDSYVEFGGTLQNQERNYFGPVNIQRLHIKLMTDKGDVVDLNNANWSFTLICEQLNKATNIE